MGMGSLHGNAKKLSAKNVGCTDTAADHSSPGSINAGIRPLSPAQSEFHDAVALCRIAYSCSLGCDQALMIDNV